MELIPKRFFLDDFFQSEEQNMKCDIYHKDNKYYIEVDLPGLKKEDINISYNKGYINVSISKNEEENISEKTYIMKERKYQHSQRTFFVGDIKEEDIKAEYKEGTLTISVEKQEQIDTTKKIEIE